MIPAPEGVGWGTTNTPREKWIDLHKHYRTRDGKEVTFHIQLTNSLNCEVTFPVKGSIDRGPGKKPEYHIWTLDGRSDLFEERPEDLVEVN
jgi:hypothetical protein